MELNALRADIMLGPGLPETAQSGFADTLRHCTKHELVNAAATEHRLGLIMAAQATTVYSHITKQPGVRGGKACIDSTRIAVVDVVAVLKMGKTAEQILVAYPDLSLAQVHAAIGEEWIADGRVFAGLVWWPRKQYARMTAGDVVRFFESLAAEDDPFKSYPIRFLKPR